MIGFHRTWQGGISFHYGLPIRLCLDSNCPPFVFRVRFSCFCGKLGNCEEELPKKPVGRLSVNCRPSVDRQVTDSLPTVNQQVTDRLRKKENCGKHEQLT